MVCGCRTQLTTDQLKIYLPAVDLAFESRVDYGMLQKYYAGEGTQSECIGVKKIEVTGSPELKHISTSFVERANLTITSQAPQRSFRRGDTEARAAAGK